MLLGEYRRRVDDAGWLCIPYCLRYAMHQLYAPDDTTLILTTFFDWCVVCYPVFEWYRAPEKLRQMGASSQEIRDFFASSAACPLDTKGRLYLPHLFCEYAAIEREVLLIGVVKHLELWEPRQWEQYVAEETGRW